MNRIDFTGGTLVRLDADGNPIGSPITVLGGHVEVEDRDADDLVPEVETWDGRVPAEFTMTVPIPDDQIDDVLDAFGYSYEEQIADLAPTEEP